MNANYVELSGLIANSQKSLIDKSEYSQLTLSINNGLETSLIPVYVLPALLVNIDSNSAVRITGEVKMKSEDLEPAKLIIIGHNVISLAVTPILEEPEGFFDAPFDESCLDESNYDHTNSEKDVYTLPVEAFNQSDINEQSQGVFITNDHQRLDLSSNEAFEKLVPAKTEQFNGIDYDKLWALSSRDLIVEMLKRDHSIGEMKAMIWIALSKEIQANNILAYNDLKKFFMKFSDIIKLGTRQFNGNHIAFIRIRVSHFSGKDYIFRFISPIFNETPTAPLEWNDFVETYDHLNPKHHALQLKHDRLEQLFARSESTDNTVKPMSEMEHNSAALSRSSLVAIYGF